MYNGAIFAQLSATEYGVYLGNEDSFVAVRNAPNPAIFPYSPSPGQMTIDPINVWDPKNESFDVDPMPIRAKRMVNLTNEECIRAYGRHLVRSWRAVVLISREYPIAGLNGVDSVTPPEFSWICSGSDFCIISDIDPNAWVYKGRQIDYCMAEPISEYCTARFCIPFFASVIGAGLIKIACVLYIAHFIKLQPSFKTTGDAISSFLERPDPTTKGKCATTSKFFDKKATSSQNFAPEMFGQSKRRIWWRAVFWQNILLFALSIIGFGGIFLAFFLVYGYASSPKQLLNDFRQEGWGNPTTTASSNIPFTMALFDTNSAQIPLSFLYVSGNAILTSMLANREWLSYSKLHKPLRVTSPVGRQISTSFLSLPWKYSLSVMVCSTLLHWLASEAFFAVYVYHFNANGFQMEYDQTDLNWTLSGEAISQEAIVVLLVVAAVIFLCLTALGFRRFPETSMPLGANSSAAISAACHPHDLDVDAGTRLVKWGELDLALDGVEYSQKCGEDTIVVRHLAFSSLKVKEPECGVLYAGH